MLINPSDRVKEALKRLAQDDDFQQITAWLEFSLLELDQENRVQTDPVRMRHVQGGGQAIHELLEHARGRNRAIARPMVNSRAPG